MKKRAVLFVVLILFLSIGLCCCGQKNGDSEKPAPSETTNTDLQTEPTNEESTSTESSVSHNDTQTVTFGKVWDYDEHVYSFRDNDVEALWEEFKRLRDSGASTDELIAALTEVTAEDRSFVPGAVELAKYYMVRYHEVGDTSSPSNAMNALTAGYAATQNPIFIELKNELGWEEYSKIIEKAKDALKQNDRVTAYEMLNTLPEEYFNILEAWEIIEILNYFDDTYYYLVLGPALGNQYIVHFRLDGTYERIKMNEDGIYDSGSWAFEYSDGQVLCFDNGLQFQGANGSYFHIEYDSDYEKTEFTLKINADGMAKEQFNTIAQQQTAASDLVELLTANLWQVDDGWYHRFNDDGTGIVSMTDDSYSYGFTYFEAPEIENTIFIRSSDGLDEWQWVYDPVSGSLFQVSYGYDMNTDTVSTYHKEVVVYCP